MIGGFKDTNVDVGRESFDGQVGTLRERFWLNNRQ